MKLQAHTSADFFLFLVRRNKNEKKIRVQISQKKNVLSFLFSSKNFCSNFNRRFGMKKVKKAKKMCEYTKYKIAASSIATLLGVWGPARQYNEICTLAKRPHREQTESWSASSKRFLDQCGISQEWDALKLRAGTSAFQEHIEVVSKQATDLLLNNRLVDTVVDLDALDNMDPRLVLCRELRNSVVSIATKAYGRNSEPIFIQQFNSCIEESGQIHSMQHELFRQ